MILPFLSLVLITYCYPITSVISKNYKIFLLFNVLLFLIERGVIHRQSHNQTAYFYYLQIVLILDIKCLAI